MKKNKVYPFIIIITLHVPFVESSSFHQDMPEMLLVASYLSKDEKFGDLDDLISSEVSAEENLKVDYPVMGTVTVYLAQAGFFILELYAKMMTRLRKIFCRTEKLKNKLHHVSL
jgi:hypothetical protein